MWTPLTDPPKESGWYIVAHRGTAKITHYMHRDPDTEYASNAKFGWRDDPTEFGATHYQPVEEITQEQCWAAEDHWQELVTERDALQKQVDELNARIVMKRHTWKEGKESGERQHEKESLAERQAREQEILNETN